MDKRAFIKYSLGAAVTLTVTGSAISWVSVEQSDAPLSTASIIEAIDTLMLPASLQSLVKNGEWSAYKVFVHCAQSVDYSISGYPLHKSDFFKRTVGKIAFSAFSAKRKMRHNLSEEIPGASTIAKSGDVLEALAQLKQSLKNFQQFNGELKAHFAYGPLNKKEYELAHAMHFINHMQEFLASPQIG
ncbi:MAG: hypothetical protein ACJAVV_003380 [Alphaproteobacteria bacterium]